VYFIYLKNSDVIQIDIMNNQSIVILSTK